MTAILRNEAQGLTRGSLILAGLLAMITGFFLAVFPAMKAEAEVIQDAYPEYMLELMGFEELHTIEGFTAGYIFPFVWILFGGIYFAYLGAGLIAGDIRSRKLDLTLSKPVSRESLLVQKVAALWVPLVVLNGAVMIVLLLGSVVVGEAFDLVTLVVIHLLGVPYLLACAGIGLVLSTVLDRVGTAQVAALGLVFMLWLVDGVSEMEPEYEWIGVISPSRYFDPTDMLVHGEYAFLDIGFLLVGFLGLVGLATAIFVRRDI